MYKWVTAVHIIKVMSCSNISAYCIFLIIFFMFEYKCMHLFSKTKCIFKYKCMHVYAQGYGIRICNKSSVTERKYRCFLDIPNERKVKLSIPLTEGHILSFCSYL